MIVFDLSCAEGHRFEGWFRSSSAFEEQGAKGLLLCPQCGSTEVAKAPMAPAVPAKGNARRPDAPVQGSGDGEGSEVQAGSQGGALPPALKQAMEKLAKLQAEMIKDSTYVGDRFAEETRAMHYGEKDAVLIHGKADADEARELFEEGIAFAPLLIPFTPPDETN
ncbi:DUF1178 family protein [Alteriqipengyuania lutimaris]|uniref:DUF1178 family protein n=1 Tax=Alteriqipengyuania lutimaris TaxID=1538146 RepID=A0A395LM05_9SPHN|nr:DUF1178 family protein [Alteriqipengyuania lutimaris]MBB3032828.1 hypothetical protein [Alteriqipengyuania lutimaris]RDS78076.1 DUF1178 family protein [Alteriqipengyuania lutimaris]